MLRLHCTSLKKGECWRCKSEPFSQVDVMIQLVADDQVCPSGVRKGLQSLLNDPTPPPGPVHPLWSSSSLPPLPYASFHPADKGERSNIIHMIRGSCEITMAQCQTLTWLPCLSVVWADLFCPYCGETQLFAYTDQPFLKFTLRSAGFCLLVHLTLTPLA